MTDTLEADPGERLGTGWDPGTATTSQHGTDTFERAIVLATAERVLHVAEAMGQPITRTDAFVAADTGLPSALANWAVLLRPVIDPDDRVIGEIAAAFPAHRPYVVVGPWPTPHLGHRGLLPVGHPPAMLRPVGLPAVLPSPRIPATDGFVVTEAIDGPSVEVAERVLIDGYPLPELAPVEPGRFLDERVLGGPIRLFVGWWRGAPVATASVTVAHGIGLVELVATMSNARGRGFGALVTQAAALADPTVPAALIASDLGRPVYERLGFLPLSRWTMWMHR